MCAIDNKPPATLAEAKFKLATIFLNILFNAGFILFGGAVLDMHIFQQKMKTVGGYRLLPDAKYLPNDYDILMPARVGSVKNLQEWLARIFQRNNLSFDISVQPAAYYSLLEQNDEQYKVTVTDYLGISILSDFVFLSAEPVLGRFDFDITSLKTSNLQSYQQIGCIITPAEEILYRRMNEQFSVVHDFNAYNSCKKEMVVQNILTRIVNKVTRGFQLINNYSFECIVKPGIIDTRYTDLPESIFVLSCKDSIYMEFTTEFVKQAISAAWAETQMKTKHIIGVYIDFDNARGSQKQKKLIDLYNIKQKHFISSALSRFYKKLNNCRPWI